MQLLRSQLVVRAKWRRYSEGLTTKRYLTLWHLEIFIPHVIRNGVNIKKAKVRDLTDKFCTLVDGIEEKQRSVNLVANSDEACACVWSSACGAFDTETQLTRLEEGRQADVQTAKKLESFNALDKKPGAEEEFIQRRQYNDMCPSINEVATLRGPLQIVHAFSAAAQMGVPMMLKMVEGKVHNAFISSSSAASSSACANSSFCGNEEETTHVAKFQEVKHSKELREK
ncbi:uncharacterized protein MONOS_8545 [Monocercomonoides exilis]|uniref:uncharacterized protein n=1 Tax=Monocercomonoides exilis TaxID=2049356 RepID=UPI003559DDA9|nr:hypothetical protein MONOS_8545 [Monocercomonoides exilis]|eukprot:MONOS_8545.1-p1 / transcript=MONOS_8545.1 / gene=MONOS_8545 / organism=Monocercomonoides_exilis_PA203 / gene_product=unspecified product / transcript_product=unspecified product / location=Mono_scaffold00325:7480-8375(-) / protein_length=227 / sequence_SO=supercontig / SO=protein_coding / is_pseudo=false